MTMNYPEQKLDMEGDGYKFDPKENIGIPGYKGRHLLVMDKCTGCQLCAIACDGIAIAIDMITEADTKVVVNKKSLFPQIDYSRCVFCGLCVDACPFDALVMTNHYELAGYDRKSLIFKPKQLAIPPKDVGQFVKFNIKDKEAYHE
ncbi:MAG: 4Fe-4S binding protein [Thaumarchaeota archaeon]|nr:4Fe-4S binding protein [Nitrososphaerota archaeon]